jgi:hypothetical protein
MKTLLRLTIQLFVLSVALGLCKPAYAQDTFTVYLPIMSADYVSNPIEVEPDGTFTYIDSGLFIVGCFPYDPNQPVNDFPTGLQSSSCGLPYPDMVVFEDGSATFPFLTETGLLTLVGCFVPNWGCTPCVHPLMQ